MLFAIEVYETFEFRAITMNPALFPASEHRATNEGGNQPVVCLFSVAMLVSAW
jgi:hypothetical protein